MIASLNFVESVCLGNELLTCLVRKGRFQPAEGKGRMSSAVVGSCMMFQGTGGNKLFQGFHKASLVLLLLSQGGDLWSSNGTVISIAMEGRKEQCSVWTARGYCAHHVG